MDMMEKRECIRTEILQQRENLSPSDRAMLSKRIAKHVIEWIQESEKRVEDCPFNAVMVYLSMKSEVETHELVESLLNQGKQVIAPVVDTKSGQLITRRIQNLKKDLVRHRYGMLEPNVTCSIFPPDQLQLILVPGIAFDMNGYRLGYGKGFYDRFLPTCPDAITIGVAFETQLVGDTYPQPWDIPVKHIFTEKGQIRK